MMFADTFWHMSCYLVLYPIYIYITQKLIIDCNLRTRLFHVMFHDTRQVEADTLHSFYTTPQFSPSISPKRGKFYTLHRSHKYFTAYLQNLMSFLYYTWYYYFHVKQTFHCVKHCLKLQPHYVQDIQCRLCSRPKFIALYSNRIYRI